MLQGQPGGLAVGLGQQRGEAVQKLGGREHELAHAVRAEGSLERVAQAAVGQRGELLLREALARAVAHEAQQTLAIVRGQVYVGVQREALDVGAAIRLAQRWRSRVALRARAEATQMADCNRATNDYKCNTLVPKG